MPVKVLGDELFLFSFIRLCNHFYFSRAFIEKHYVNIKKCNPAFPILIRECAGVKPALWARFGSYDVIFICFINVLLKFFSENGNENCISLSELSAEDVLKKVEGLARQ